MPHRGSIARVERHATPRDDRAKSLWPAVFLHSFHNGVSQWLFPKFFAGGDETWLGEGGVLLLACYVVAVIGLSSVVGRQVGR